VDWDVVLEVNLSSAFQLCQLVGRQMIAQESGKILNIASLSATSWRTEDRQPSPKAAKTQT
jgi:NAD(P)-dependent dehydrogenase (short-subunit alcohol dehydrogenase family)